MCLCTSKGLFCAHAPLCPMCAPRFGTKRQFSAVKIRLRQTGCPPYRTAALAVQQMLKRRLKAAGLPEILSPHAFRVLVVTDLLSQNVPLEDVQYLAGNAHPRTTQIHHRRRRRVSRNLVERISLLGPQGVLPPRDPPPPPWPRHAQPIQAK